MLIALSFLFGLGVILLAAAALAMRWQLRIKPRSLTPVGRVPVHDDGRNRKPAPNSSVRP